jgi:hypothetical protein
MRGVQARNAAVAVKKFTRNFESDNMSARTVVCPCIETRTRPGISWLALSRPGWGLWALREKAPLPKKPLALASGVITCVSRMFFIVFHI